MDGWPVTQGASDTEGVMIGPSEMEGWFDTDGPMDSEGIEDGAWEDVGAGESGQEWIGPGMGEESRGLVGLGGCQGVGGGPGVTGVMDGSAVGEGDGAGLPMGDREGKSEEVVRVGAGDGAGLSLGTWEGALLVVDGPSRHH